jgi:sirohydrochlorin ferrochelatase
MPEGTRGDGPAARALVLVAHGSRRAESNEEVRVLAERIRARAGSRFKAVEHGFLELAEPAIAQVLDAVVDAGARELVVIPYFLAAGRHVSEDVPAAVAVCRARHPEVVFEVTSHLGATDSLADLLLAIAGGSTP